MRLKVWKTASRYLAAYILLLSFQIPFLNKAAYAEDSITACAENPDCLALEKDLVKTPVTNPTPTASPAVFALRAGIGTATVVTVVLWSQSVDDEAQKLAQQKYCTANSNDSVCVPFTGGQTPDIPYNVTFEAWTTNRNEGWYPHTIFTTHYGFHEPGGSNDLVIGPVHAVNVLQQLSLDGIYPRMCYGVIDKFGLRCFFEYSNTRYYGTDDYTFKFISLAPLYQLDDTGGNPPPLDWKDWSQDKRDAAFNLISPSDWQVLNKSMPKGETYSPGDTINKPVIVFPSTDPTQPPEILPGPYRWNGSSPSLPKSPPPIAPPSPPPQQLPGAPNIPLTPEQGKALQEHPKFAQYLQNNPQQDQQNPGCIIAVVPGHIGTSQTAKPALYATYVSGSPNDFFVLSYSGHASTFDGLTPGTRHLWEAKYGYRELLSYNSSVSNSKLENIISTTLEQALEENIVAQECGYELTWAFSEESVANFFGGNWEGNLAFPQDVRYIPYPGN